MVRLVSLGALAATCAQASPTGHELFVGPYYSLNDTVVEQRGFDDVATRFRVAYCQARHQADTESYTTVFNTVVSNPDASHHPRYYSREEFKDGDSFNTHLYNVRNAFANAKGVSVNTGFFAFGTEDDLYTIRDNAQTNHMTTFVKDTLSFKKSDFKGDDYFSLDYFMDVQKEDLPSFRSAWQRTREAAWPNNGILSFAMGVNETEDGSYKAVLQETFESAAAYLDWITEGRTHLSRTLETGTISDHPNPFTMASTSEQLQMVDGNWCYNLPHITCLQYTFDTCEGVGDVVV